MAPKRAVMCVNDIVALDAGTDPVRGRCVRSLGRAKAIVALVGSIASGCAHYQPSPLRPSAAVLSSPDLSLISADAQKIHRPYLTTETIYLSKALTPNAPGTTAPLLNPDPK